MRIRQSAYFGIFSVTLTAADITGRLGVEPDVIAVLGSRDPQRSIPRHHSWRVTSEQPGLTVADHLDIVVGKLEACAGAIGGVVEEIVSASPDAVGVGAVLQVVRHFDDEEGEDEEISVLEQPGGGQLERLPGQHQLLGWRLSPGVIAFLGLTHAALDVDEYG
jgi:hypothetical protein